MWSQSPEGSDYLCNWDNDGFDYDGSILSQSPEGSDYLCNDGINMVQEVDMESQSPEGSDYLCNDNNPAIRSPGGQGLNRPKALITSAT